jgi:hypothetical protein
MVFFQKFVDISLMERPCDNEDYVVNYVPVPTTSIEALNDVLIHAVYEPYSGRQSICDKRHDY